ncbi:D-inositol-3-phosphate glycosyltransferase [Rubripirellula lacrimiformis]|uniref:D-inositol-3-phosphate glycosyltransferase n=1 Tax=Rubripirellula lacrimiformis TaxID=1930273 RepID=A0A517N8L7_9BACT|nr:glycosyltransferase family 1 protein [Rubripirellula lacrimiformis]QDT03489.1 D-inositol-3-phosphate glycosyltransferase [Rubripirellula lacrimiformis]
MNIAFRHIGSQAWQGGANYLLNLCRVLQKQNGHDLNPIMFHGPGISDEDHEPLKKTLGTRLIECGDFTPDAIARRRWKSVITGCDKVAQAAFESEDTNVVFENADFYGRNFPIPTLAWAPDFQHRHFPKMFPRKQYWRREIGFRMQFSTRRQVVVSSQDAANDCRRFYGVPEERISVVRFSTPFELPPTTEASEQTRSKYSLPERFFLLPNQFWNHKNHSLVVDALERLNSDKNCPVIAVTGGASHPSCVSIFESIQRRVSKLGLQNNFRILGRIPFDDLKGLRSNCVALINPSLFEGWSTTIEEAKAIGTPLLLSDLDVHIEQAPKNATFFNRYSADDFAEKLIAIATTASATRPTVDTLQSASKDREDRFVSEFQSAVSATIQNHA